MTQTLDTQPGGREKAGSSGLDRTADGRPEQFLSELRAMTPEERIRASRYTMSRHERCIYAAHYPDEVPLLNGELEWIARNCV